ncbi:TetR family transcriptional regulator [Streptomyces sp. TRM 70351]|uniref:TetR/AcrR family transcriptional regulator n=1 Tax=Streptomyces sp. TRM 70351 TaxID=3116552 RepID=UPI002E7AED2E|nr:TetR family transcriptional regulator [Streptomyces sp. TRM 70351]MEE1930193.1 TetR family transcriptional regulator [Streptomyces sp. TRM 70351]
MATQDVRRKMLDAAVELIAERGWSAVSTRSLAERAGVGAGLVHYHFASLDALLTEAALDRMRGLLDGLAALLDDAGSLDAGLERLLASLDGHSAQDTASLLFSEAYLRAARDAALRDGIADVLTDARDRIARWLTEHGAETPGPTAAVLTAAVDGVMLHRPLNPALTPAAVGPVLRRMLTQREAGDHR